jgi:hypothetical protein
MPYSIDDFLSEVKKGVAKACNFTCQITSPSGVGGQGDARSLEYRLISFDLSGRKAKIFPYEPYGPKRNVVYGQEFPSVSATFLCSPNYAEKEFFEKWQDAAFGRARTSASTNQNSWSVNYYDTYVGTIIVNQLDDANEVKKTYQFREAFPISIETLTLDWNSDTILGLGVEFAYFRYTTT